MKRISMIDLGLTKNDFNISTETINFQVYITINGIKTITLTCEIIQDIHSQTGFDTLEMFKLDAIDWYLNNIKIVRKMKLEKIKKVDNEM